MAAATGLLVIAGVLTLAILEAAQVRSLVVGEERPPLWDMAKNGRMALEVALDIRALDSLAFLRHLNQHDTWPPAYALWLAPFFLLAGSGFAAATLANAVLFVLLPLALLWAAREIEPENRLGAGVLGASLALAAPLYRLHSVLVMRELASAVVLVLAVALHARARRQGDSPRAWSLAAVAATALFFIKYNYGLLWIAAVLLEGLLTHRVGWHRLSRFVWPQENARGRKAVLVCLVLLIAAKVLGQSVGGSAYALLLLSLCGFAWARLRTQTLRETSRLAFGRLPVEARCALKFLVLPVVLWCAIPQPMHLRGLIDFLDNRGSGLGAMENLSFYSRAMLHEYAAHPWIGAAVLGFALVALRALFRSGGARALALAAVLFTAASVLHPYKIERFFAPAAALLFLLAGGAAVGWTKRPWTSLAVGLLLGTVVWGGARSERHRLDEKFLAGYRVHSGPPQVLAAVDRLIAKAPPAGPRLAVLGGFNEVSPDLVAWRFLQSRGSQAPRPEIVSSMPRPPQAASMDAVVAALHRWLAKRQPQTVWAVTLDPTSPLALSTDFRDRAAWQVVAVEALRREPGWRELATVEEPALGLQISSFACEAPRSLALRPPVLR